MSESVQDSGVSLHDIEALQHIDVRPDISLRPLQAGDASDVLSVLESDPSIRSRVTVAANMRNADDVARVVADMEADPELIRYAICDQDNRCIGLVSFWLDSGFFGQVPMPNTYGFGYFVDLKERGKGIVPSSVSSIMGVAEKNIPGIEGFTAFCEDNNSESIKVLESLGFKPTDSVYGEPDMGWPERQYVRGLNNE